MHNCRAEWDPLDHCLRRDPLIKYEYSRVGTDENGVYWMLSAMTLNAVLLVSLILLSNYFKTSYQGLAKQMRQKQGLISSSANWGTFLNIVSILLM